MIDENEQAAAQSTPTGAPPEVAPSARPRGRTWVVLAIAAAVIAALTIAGFVGRNAYMEALERQRKEDVAAQAAAVDTQLEKLWLQADLLDSLWDATEPSDDPATLKPLSLQTVSAATSATASIKKLRSQVEEISDPEISKDYGEVLTQVAGVFASAVTANAQTTETVTLSKQSQRAEKAVSKGYDLINESVEASNARRHAAGLEKAQAARRQLQTAQAAFLAIKKIGGSDDSTDESLTWASELITLARLQEELARLGMQGSVSGYNAQIRKLNRQQKKIDDMDVKPYLSGDYLWDSIHDQNGDLTSSLKTAHSKWQEIRLRVAAGDF